jgi:hypothetical protein
MREGMQYSGKGCNVDRKSEEDEEELREGRRRKAMQRKFLNAIKIFVA